VVAPTPPVTPSDQGKQDLCVTLEDRMVTVSAVLICVNVAPELGRIPRTAVSNWSGTSHQNDTDKWSKLSEELT
jgi:hypothetical protein